MSQKTSNTFYRLRRRILKLKEKSKLFIYPNHYAAYASLSVDASSHPEVLSPHH